MFVFGVIPVRIQSENGKIRTGITLNTDNFQAVLIFIISNYTLFFNSASVLLKFFDKLSPKCGLSVAYYIETFSYRDTIFSIFVSTSTSWSICVCVCLIYMISFSTIIFIYITINHIILLIKKNFFEYVCQKFGLRELLSLCLFYLPISAWRCL